MSGLGSQVAMAASMPTAGLVVPTETMIGQTLRYTASFDNTGSTTGYGPYLDLALPAPGADGAAAGTADDDGITFVGASYLGAALAPVSPSPLICAGTYLHPLTKLATSCTPGTQVVILRLPYGSFTPDQPRIDVDVQASLSSYADLGAPLTLEARGGFMYGADPLDNPATDPPLVGASTTAATTPTLLSLTKRYLGPEDETATGPNFPEEYELVVDVAAGQTLTNLDITDLLPPTLQYVGVVSASPAACAITPPLVEPSKTAPAAAPNNRLTVRCAAVTGSTGTRDAVVTLRFYVPRLDAVGAAVLPPTTADDRISIDDAKASGSWTPLDPRDGVQLASSDLTLEDHRLEDQAIAIQKRWTIQSDVGGAGVTAGDTLEYTLDFQVSDFFAFDQIVVDDVLSDGLHFAPGFTPTLTVAGNGFALGAAPLATANYTHDTSQIGNDLAPATDGSTHLSFRVSDELLARSAATLGRLVGGCVDPVAGTAAPTCPAVGAYNDGGTTGRLVYRAVVQEDFTDTYPSNDQSVDQGDQLRNAATIDGRVLNTANLAAPTGFREADDTAAVATIAFGQLSKTIYAVNGSTTLPSPLRLTPGDRVTYRFRYTLPSSDFENLHFVDYLPLPVFDATELTTFDPALTGTVPAAGKATYGPADTYHLLSGTPAPTVPALSTTAPTADNTVSFTYGDYDDAQSRSSEIDLLLTVTVSDAPFADGLLLTNQVRAYEASTNGGDQQLDSIVQIKLSEPSLALTKGAVATDAPAAIFAPTPVGPVAFSAPGGSCARFAGTISSASLAATPIHSDLSGVDAGDRVTFAVVVENSGGSAAFDTRLRDILPAGFAIPAGGLNLCVADGTGAPLAYTALGDGLFDPAGGIELTDPAALGPGNDGAGTALQTGHNIAVVTYDLVLAGTVQPRQQLANTATLWNFAGQLGGRDHTTSDLTDSATVQVAAPSVAKVLVGTEIDTAVNSATQAVVGELATYRVRITVPEGVTPAVTLADTLDSGLAFVDLVSATPSAGVSFSGSATPVVSGSGRSLSWDLGTVTNADRDNAQPDTIELVYRAVVLDVAGNQSSTLLNNSALLTTGGVALPAVSAANLTVIEPALAIAKTASPTSGDAGDAVAFAIQLRHAAGSAADAFDVTLSDPLPTIGGASALINPTLAVVDSAGLVTAADFELVGSNAAGWTLRTTGSIDLPYSATRTVTITVSGTLTGAVSPGATVANTAAVQWTSLDGAVVDRSAANAASDERTGAGGVDDYAASSTATVTIFSPAPVKSIVTTSAAHTVCQGTPCVERVAVGEIVRYRLVVRVAEGASPDLRLTDRLPAGLQFFDDGTTKLALVSTDPGLTSSTLGGAGLLMTGDETTVASITPTFGLPGSAILGAPFGDGTDPTFALGDLANTDSDDNQEFAVLEFNALVRNVAANQAFNNATGAAATTTLSNDFQVLLGSTVIATSNVVDAVVAEPVLTVAKTITTAPVDAGDTVVYRLVVTNTVTGANRAAAFDVALVDTLSADLDLQSVVVATPVGTSAVDTSTLGVGGVVRVALNQLAPSADIGGAVKAVTVTVTARVVNTAAAGRTIPNTAAITYTSLPASGSAANATGSVTPGASGDATGERTGSGGVNDYSASGAVSTTLATPTIDKLTPAVTRYTIGDLVSYDIKVTLPEGTTGGLIVTDDLPAGMSYLSHQIVTGAGGALASAYAGDVGSLAVTATPATSPGASGVDLVLTFPTVTTTADNDSANNTFLVQVTARVLNVSTVLDGATLSNSANLKYTNPNTAAQVTVTDATPAVITINEPRIVTTKSVLPTGNTQAGATLTYTLTFTNNLNSTAYDVTAQDTLPAGISFGALSPAGKCTYYNGVSSVQVDAQTTVAGQVVTFDSPTAGGWDIPATNPDSYIRCVYTATVQPGIYINGSYPNSVDADWTGQDGVNSVERIYDDTTARNPSSRQDAAQDTASVSVTTAAPTFAKTADRTTATIGETVQYTLSINSPLGTLRSASIQDTLPAGLVYNNDAVFSGIGAPTGSSVGTPNDGSTATALTWSFGDAAITSSPATIRFTATVANVLSNQSGVARDNTAQLQYSNAAGTAQTPLSSTVRVTLQEPVLKLVKTITSAPAPADAGGTIFYQLVISHDTPSLRAAYDVVVRDTLPAGLTNVVVTGVNPSGVAAPSAEVIGNTVRVPATADGSFDLPQGAVVTINLRATLADSVTPAQTIANTGQLTWSTLDGTQPRERADGNGLLGAGGLNDYELQSTASFTTAGPALAKALQSTSDALTTGSDLAVGETATYELRVTLPEGTTPSLTLADLLPTGLQYLSATVDTTGFNGTLGVPAISGGAGDGDDVTFAFGPITVVADNDASNNSFAVLITTRVLDTAANVGLNPPGRTTLGNSASLQVGGGAPITSNAVVVAVAEPRIVTTKSVAPSSGVLPGATVTYTVRFANTGLAPAYAVTAEDRLPAGVSFVALAGCVDERGAAVPSSATTGPWLTLEGAPTPWTIVPGGYVECTYTAVASASLALDSAFTNTVDADWWSQPSATAGARRYDDAVARAADGTQDSASATFTTPAPSFGKLADRETATIGERITYTLAITAANGTLAGAQVLDTLPAGLIFDASTAPVIAGIATPATFTVGAPNDGSAAVALSWSFGDATITASPATITYSAIVADVAANQAGAARINAAELRYVDAAGAAKRLTAADSVALVEPALTISKTVGAPTAAIGDLVTYRIVVRNPAGAAVPAYEVQLTDTLPATLSYEPASIRIVAGSPAGTADASGAPALSWSFPVIAPGETATVEYDARITGSGAIAQPITNTAAVTWTSLPGAATHERTGAGGVDDYRAVSSATLHASAYTLEKTLVAPASGLAGVNDTVQFAITVTNTGGTTLTTVPLADSYDPARLHFVGADLAPADTVDDGSLSWANVGPLAAGQSRTVLVSFTARSVTPATTNVATASGVRDSGGITLVTRSDDAMVAIGAPDLQIAKTAASPSVTPGATLSYTLDYANTGTLAATSVTIAETVPANTTFDQGASTAGWSCADGAPAGTPCTFALGTVAIGATGAVQFAVDVVAGLPAGVEQIANTATIADDGSYGPDATPANNSASATTPVVAAPDLQVAKTDGDVSARPGDAVAYTLSYRNNGDQTATGVVLAETVPANTTFLPAASTAGWSCAAGNCTLALPDLAPGATGTAVFVVRVDSPLAAGVTQVANTAAISDDGANGADPTPANNSGADTTPIVDAAPALSASKAVAVDDANADGAANPGEVLEYTVVVANGGNQDAAAVVFADTPGANTTLLPGSVTTTAGTVTLGNGAADSAIEVQLGTLGGGASATITFRVRIVDPLPAGVVAVANQGQLTVGNAPALPTDDPATATAGDPTTTPVLAAAQVELAKTDGGVSATAGDFVAYTLSYRNNGDQDAAGLLLRETVPANTTFDQGASTPGWSCADSAPAGTVCTLPIGTLAGHASGSAVFAVLVDGPLPNGTAEISNTAVVADAGGDLATAGDTTPLVIAPDLQLTKTDGGGTTRPNASIVYTLAYRNVGSTEATGVVLTETVPANTTFDAAAGDAGWNCADSAPAGTQCTYAVGDVAVGPGGSVRFGVRVAAVIPPFVTAVDNTAVVADDGTNGADPTPADNAASVSTLFDPTAITLVSFTATRRSDGVAVEWRSSHEDTTWGYVLYRSLDGSWASAVRVTPDAIPATGRTTGGASYRWLDPAVGAGQRPTYWLQEVPVGGSEAKGATPPSDPAQLRRPVYLPHVSHSGGLR